MTAENPSTLPPILAQRRRQALRVLRLERFCRAAWPLLPATGLFISLVLLDVWTWLPPWPHLILLIIFWAGLGIWIVWRWRVLPKPLRTDADRRLEQDAGLVHRPLATLDDRPARGSSPMAQALWQAHTHFVLDQVRTLRPAVLRPGIAGRDCFALRALSVIVLAALGVSAGGDFSTRLAHALWPVLPPAPSVPGPVVQAWITPPAYTGLPPIFLHGETDAAHHPYVVPISSVLSLTVSGLDTPPGLELDGHRTLLPRLAKGSFQASIPLGQQAVRLDAPLTLRAGGGAVLATWRIRMVADAPPQVTFTALPEKAVHGYAVRIPWQARDDYGIAGVSAVLRLTERPDLPPVTVPLPVPAGHPRVAGGATESDLTANPWAGLPVTLTLTANDTAGQTGQSEPVSLILPQKPFRNPLARALLSIRQSLARRPEDRRNAVGALAELGAQPDILADDPGGYLNLRAITSELARNISASAINDALNRLWLLALHIEEGGAERTARALSAARQELREALNQQKNGAPPDQREMERLMSQLERALSDHLKQMAEQASREAATPVPEDRNASLMDRLRKLDEQMRQALKEGRMEDARRAMASLDRALDRLQHAKPLTAEQKARRAKQQQARRQAQEQMKALQDLTRRQAGLLDNAQKRAEAAQQDAPRFPDFGPENDPDDGPPDQQGQGGSQSQSGQPPSGQPGQQGRRADPAEALRKADETTQQDVRHKLADLMQQLSEKGGQIPRGMAQADAAMREAIEAMRRGRDDQTVDAERRALQKLAEGQQDINRQQQANKGGRPGQDQGGEEQEDGDEDGVTLGAPSQGQRRESDGGQTPGEQAGDNDSDGAGDQHDRRDPFGRSRSVGSAAGDENGDDVRLPGQMEPMRSRDVQQELRRRGAERNRPQEELDYIDRLLQQF
ncbi:putative membrane associated protein [Granulibacter bethesdensis]|uniref:Membrane associated protein n=1 Tax=Granulibacter bethesdensis TaxID=364410 RepID=A0AAN0VEV3_9PROT|nr:DUF4175 family protein [Granulibacter bethesdensis]AHJ61879.1 putative membrane associated protein [Granulibacter bethesdensis]